MDILPSCFQKDFLAFSEKFVFENTSLSVTNTTVSSPTGHSTRSHASQKQQQRNEYHAAADDDNNNNKDNEYDDNPNEIYGPPRPTVAESRRALQEAIADGNSQLQYLRRTFFEQQLITNTLAEQCQGLAEKIQVNMFKLYQLGGPEQIQEHQRQDVVDGTAHHSGGGDRFIRHTNMQHL
ncbi:hypothetical protein ColKHC_14272 [Colletotrichum higginsianum]|nr:hypothetical protein ColKHC_14272 [Colletotrichum higginsianum]